MILRWSYFKLLLFLIALSLFLFSGLRASIKYGQPSYLEHTEERLSNPFSQSISSPSWDSRFLSYAGFVNDSLASLYNKDGGPLRTDTPKYFVYKGLLDRGIGNRLPSLIASFLFAMLSDRILLIDYPDFYRYFSPVGLPDLRLETYKSHLGKDWSSSRLDLTCDRMDFYSTIASSDLEKIWKSYKIVTFGCDDYPILPLTTNPHYVRDLQVMFPDHQYFRVIGSKLTVLSKPVNDLLLHHKIESFKEIPFKIGIHVRTKKLVPGTLIPPVSHYGGMVELVQRLKNWQKNQVRIFVAVDDVEYRNRLISYLVKLGFREDFIVYQKGDFLLEETTGGDPGTEMSAFVDLAFLAACDELILTHSSSFGTIAASWGGINAWNVYGVKEKSLESQDAWYSLSIGAEPCWYMSKRALEVMDPNVVGRIKQHPLWMTNSQCHFYVRDHFRIRTYDRH